MRQGNKKLMLMLSRWRHIGKMLLVAALVISCTSCARWREAKEVVAEAERLLAKGEIMQDTAVLTEVINTLDNPVGRVIAKDELAEAYYLMGRNMDDYCHDFAAAADYYIEADRLQTTDLVLRGRINSCMGFICKQDSCFVEALEFYERANKAFYKIGDERHIANGLVSIAEQYVNLKEYDKVDSVLSLASSYEIDSAYFARMVDVRALALYNQEMYDSALVCFLRIKDTPRPIEARCYSYMKIMHCYEFLHQLDNTIIYAEYIVSNSKNPAYRSNAYFYLMTNAKWHNDINSLSIYSHAREDEDRKLQHDTELCAQANIKLQTYLEATNYTKLIISIVAALFVVLSIGIWLVYKCYRDVLQKHAKEKQDRRDLLARRIYDHSIYFMSNKVWQDYKKLREFANSQFDNMFYKLEDAYHLSEQEMKICLMILLEYSNKQMAEILFVQPNTISKAKSKIAKQLNTSSAELRASLLDILV